LFSFLSRHGHVRPALAVARALGARGHRVLWHAMDEFRSIIEETGATFIEARRTILAPPVRGNQHFGLRLARILYRKLYVDLMQPQLADYEEIIDRHGSVDALVVDQSALGAAALHERRGIPFATLAVVYAHVPSAWRRRQTPRGWGERASQQVRTAAARAVEAEATGAYERQRALLGLTPLRPGVSMLEQTVSPFLHMLAWTPLLDPTATGSGAHFVGPLLTAAPRHWPSPHWWEDLQSGERVIHVTQGTVATENDILVRPAIEALAGFDGLVVVTTQRPLDMGSLPSNVRVAGLIPHALLLPHVTLMIGNAGFNSVKEALGHGVPQVLAPRGLDKPMVAAMAARTGAAIDLRIARPTPARIRQSVQQALSDDSYRISARRVAEEFAAWAGGQHAADLLESFVSQSCAPG
jgi:MGT family glycosyltransferase